MARKVRQMRRKGKQVGVVPAPVRTAPDIDARVALIQALIPVVLDKVMEELQADVERLAGARYAREGRLPGHVRVGRGTTATDNTPMGMVNTTVTLKPLEQWRVGMTLDRLQADMDLALQFPGFPNVWTQPVRNRLDMLLTGIKTPVGVKILGTDLNEIQRIGGEIERALQSVPGTRSVYAERVAQGYFTDIRIDRDAVARHGLTVGDVEEVIESAIGGQNITRTIEGRERYPVNVRYERGFRDSLPALRRVLVKTSVLRLRPKLMTVAVVMAGLIPILWSTGVGSDVMKPIAAPIVGGMVTSTIHVLVITPVIFYLMKTRALRRGTLRASGMHV